MGYDEYKEIELEIIDSNRFSSIRYVESKTNGVRFGRGHVVRSFTHEHTAQHTTVQIMKEHFKKMLNEIVFLLSYLHHCAFTANPEEITVNNFASTFDNAGRPQFINGLISQ